jgi:hypothetical protein
MLLETTLTVVHEDTQQPSEEIRSRLLSFIVANETDRQQKRGQA